MGGFFGDGGGIRIESQELAAPGERLFRVVGEESKMANTHEPFGQHMKQEAVDKFLDFEFLGLEPVPVFSIAISEGDLPIVD